MKSTKPESDETEVDETDETPEEQNTEAEEGTEGVVIPEEFQSKVHELLKDCDKHCLSHIRDRVYQKEDELRKAQEPKASKGNGPTGTMTVDPSIEG